MRIIQIEVLDKVRRKLHIEGVSPFWLYRSDIAAYGLEENADLSEQLYELLRKEKVLLYAKKKILEILERMDRTEQELKNKLLQRDFPSDIIEEAIAYAKQFHYVDDFRFAKNFIHIKSTTKSKRQICFMLYQKGIAKEQVDQAYEEFLQMHKEQANSLLEDGEENSKVNPEVATITKIIRRKGKPIEEYTREELQRLTASLYRKGFSSDSIRTVLSCDYDID
jgi:regulatory protein